MSDDILVPVPAEKVVAFRKPRWNFFQVHNQAGTLPIIKAQGEWQDVNRDGAPLGNLVGDMALDMEIQFDPSNELHVKAFDAFDAAIKDEYRRRRAPAPVVAPE